MRGDQAVRGAWLQRGAERAELCWFCVEPMHLVDTWVVSPVNPKSPSIFTGNRPFFAPPSLFNHLFQAPNLAVANREKLTLTGDVDHQKSYIG